MVFGEKVVVIVVIGWAGLIVPEVA